MMVPFDGMGLDTLQLSQARSLIQEWSDMSSTIRGTNSDPYIPIVGNYGVPDTSIKDADGVSESERISSA